MGKLGSLYENTSIERDGRAVGHGSKRAVWVVEASCPTGAYGEFVDLVCGGLYCAGCDMLRSRKPGEGGEYYADFVYRGPESMDAFRVTFGVSEGGYSFAGKRYDDLYSLLVGVGAACESFVFGGHPAFMRLDVA